jgi:hypothetical protein
LERLLASVEGELGVWRARALKAEREPAPSAGKGKASPGGGSAELAQARHRIGLRG